MQRTLFNCALFALLFFAAFSPALAQAQQQINDNGPLSDPPKLAFKLILRTRQPVFASGSTITVEAACVSLPLASAEWQTHWSNACAKLELKFEQARVGGFWGGMNTDWIENRLHLCRLPQGEEYEASSGPGLYSKPEWHLITISPQKLEGLRGLVLISAHALCSGVARNESMKKLPVW